MAEPTTYIVLRHVSTGEASGPVTWEAVDWNVPAPNAEAAIRKTAAALNPADGAYVATPMRSWRPLTVTATTQTVIQLTQLEDASA